MHEQEGLIGFKNEQEAKVENTGIIIVAAGNGIRLDGHESEAPKTFIDLAGKAMCIRALDPFIDMGFKNVVLVVPEKWQDRARESIGEQDYDFPIKIVRGGERRIDSVRKGMESLAASQWVMVHDGDRPFVTQRVISDVLSAPGEFLAVVPGVAVSDTVRIRDGNKSLGTLDRNTMTIVQTPQRFHAQTLREIFDSATDELISGVNDEATIFERKGLTVGIVNGDQKNFKITYKTELVFAEVIAAQELFRAPEV